MRPVLAICLVAGPLLAQTQATLTLEQAQALALRNHPLVASARLNAQAAEAIVTGVRSALQPQVTGNITGVGAEAGSVIAAGMLQTSSLSSRTAGGLGVTQLVTDFGRTSNLTEAARLRAGAQLRGVDTTRAQVLLQVDQAYYLTLSADTILKVAQARVDMQRLTARQVRALSDSGLKSTLDVSFADVAFSEAELALYQAENAAKSNRALLAMAMGEQGDLTFSLADASLPPQVTAQPENLIKEAFDNRPELAAAKLIASAAEHFAEAEKRLMYPTVSAAAIVGVTPFRTSNLDNHYSAAGVNISLPILNGGLFSSRRTEAQLRAQSADKETEALAVRIAGNVRTAWLEAETSWRRIDVTARLSAQTATALRLAQARYEIGLSGILELTQSQLALISAQIAAADARYDYLIRIANLNYAIGALR